MTNDSEYGRLSGSREPSPSCTGLDPSGFDPGREGHLLLSRVQCALMDRELARELVRLHPGDFESARAAMVQFQRGTEMLAKVFEQMGGIRALEALQAIAMEARQGGDGETRPHPKDDSAGLQGIAQPQSVSGLSHTGVDRG